MQTKYIKVDQFQPAIALQKFAIAIERAVMDGYTVSGDPQYHARELGSGQFDITLVRDVTPLASYINDNPTDAGANTNFVQTLPSPPQPETTITTFPPHLDGPIMAHLESCKTKQDLLDFAARYAIVVPEDKQVFTAVKKYIKEQLAPKTV